jgi:hypothetical protein
MKNALGYVVNWPHSARIPVAQVTLCRPGQNVETRRVSLDNSILIVVVSKAL